MRLYDVIKKICNNIQLLYVVHMASSQGIYGFCLKRALISLRKILLNILKCLEPHLIFKMAASLTIVYKSSNPCHAE